MMEWVYDFIHHKDTFVTSIAILSIIIPLHKLLMNLSVHQLAEKVKNMMHKEEK